MRIDKTIDSDDRVKYFFDQRPVSLSKGFFRNALTIDDMQMTEIAASFPYIRDTFLSPLGRHFVVKEKTRRSEARCQLPFDSFIE